MSSDFKRMIEVVLTQKPEITAEQVRDLIDEKKRRVGAGYLTDQGALFLVGADLGISFDHFPRLQSGLKDLYVGAKDITTIGRIMNIYPIHKFLRKESEEESATRTIIIYDKDSKVKLKLWDAHVNIPEKAGLQSDQLIKISKGYVKAGLDGKPVINLGTYGTVEAVQDDGSIPTIDSITITIDDVKEPQENTVIYGTINSNPRISDFTNQRGEMSRSLQLQISNDANTRSLRAVIWNIEEVKIPKVFNFGAKIKLIGVRVKQGNPQYGNGDFEVHGDEGTILQFDLQQEIEVMPLRIISVGEETGRGSISCLAADRAGRTLSLYMDNQLVPEASKLVPGTMIECVPTRIFGTSIILSKDESYVRVMEDEDQSFPSLSKFESKIKDVQLSPNPYVIEAIVLQVPDLTDVNTKSGELVTVSSTLLGDDTGEIRLVGWRNQSSSVSRLVVGDRVRVMGVSASAGRESGKVELTLKPYSSVIKLS